MSKKFMTPNPADAGLLNEWKGMTEPVIGPLHSSPAIKRYAGNPIVQSKDVPYRSDLVMNAGVTKFQGRYIMLFRNDIRIDENKVSEGVDLGLAYSQDGFKWKVAPKPCSFSIRNEEIMNMYDARLLVLEGRCYINFALDTKHGTRGGIAVTDDFQKFEVISISAPDNRNFALFPEKIHDRYIRMERPFPIYGRPGYPERFDIWMSDSPNLKHWGNSELLVGVEHVPYANLKIGPGAPPVRTPKGWLCVFHAADFDPSRGKNGFEVFWKKRYTAGLMLLDLDDPYKVLGIYQEPLIAPEAPYEISNGYRHNVIFPTGLILEDSGEVKIYYGAADTVMAMATASLDDLLKCCLEKGKPV